MSICEKCGKEFALKRPGRAQRFCSVHCAATRRKLPFLDKVDSSGGLDSCWPWLGRIDAYGYGAGMDGGADYKAHRRMFFMANGYAPPVVRHACDNPPCVNPLHLLGGTQSENVADAVRRGRVRGGGRPMYGSDNPGAKLNEESVREIRRLYAAGGVSQASLGRRFGVGQTAIWKVVSGFGWTTVREVGP